MIIHKIEILPHEHNGNFRRLVITSYPYSGLGRTTIELIVSIETLRFIHNRIAEALGYDLPKTIFDKEQES